MEYRRFYDTIVARLDRGKEILASLETLCEKENVSLGWVSAIGAVNEAEIGCFDTNEKKYYSKKYTGIYEIASLSGTVSVKDAKPYLHIHAVLGDKEGTVIGGHLSRAVASATCEVALRVLDGTADRTFSPETGLNLITFQD